MLKRIFTKKTSKTDSKKTSTKKKGAKKKKIIKSTEKAVKKKMAPTKKTEYVQDGISTDAINSIGASSILEEASDSGESSANGDGISTDQYDEGSKENS